MQPFAIKNKNSAVKSLNFGGQTGVAGNFDKQNNLYFKLEHY